MPGFLGNEFYWAHFEDAWIGAREYLKSNEAQSDRCGKMQELIGRRPRIKAPAGRLIDGDFRT
jgi:hypothetical protein